MYESTIYKCILTAASGILALNVTQQNVSVIMSDLLEQDHKSDPIKGWSPIFTIGITKETKLYLHLLSYLHRCICVQLHANGKWCENKRELCLPNVPRLKHQIRNIENLLEKFEY